MLITVVLGLVPTAAAPTPTLFERARSTRIFVLHSHQPCDWISRGLVTTEDGWR